jgi:ABC-type antimicrobial peptide transport system permease subunit
METLSQGVLFLSLIFDIIILLFVIISILLIYSLLMISIESKAFEIGVMRMVGLSKNGLIVLIAVQAIMFVLPAIIFGIALSFPALKGLYAFMFSDDLGIQKIVTPTGFSIMQALFLGVVIPFASSILPV